MRWVIILSILVFFYIPPEVPTIEPPQRAVELLVDQLTIWGMERVPEGAEVYRQYIRIFYHIEFDGAFWGAYIRIFHHGPGKPIFEIGSLDEGGNIRRGGLDIPKEDP